VRMADAADTIAAFGFGASSIALFARVAGGICKSTLGIVCLVNANGCRLVRTKTY
jgi:Na+/H+-translocating membrane pyrophosphatase